MDQFNGGGSEIRTGLNSYSIADNYNVESLTFIGSGNFTGTGNSSANVLTGGAGNDSLDGKSGADSMSGGAGNDTYYVENVNDLVVENAGGGLDNVYESLSNYTLGANVENVFLTSSFNANASGNALANFITGNGGANALDGAGGADTLTGGGGADVFQFRRGEASGDRVTDFSGVGGQNDKLYFYGFGTAAQGASFVKLDSTHWVINSSDGAAHETITLANAPTLVAANFRFF